jgi:transposase
MSLRPQSIPDVPEETAEVARKAFPKGNVYMQMRDVFGSIYTDDEFVDLYPRDGQSAMSPWRLALVTVMQYAENLSDRQAADAVRDRIAWKYALSLELRDAGFDYSVLSEFRTRLLEGNAGQRLLDRMLEQFQATDLLKARGQQRTDSTHVLAAVRELNRLENVGETLRHALNSLTVVAPEWLREQVTSDWFDRYSQRVEQYRLPKSTQKQKELAEIIGQDGYSLLDAIYTSESMTWLREIPAVETLRQVWVQQFWLDNEQVRQREVQDMPPVGAWIRSPYDTEARYCSKRTTGWLGYRVHLTETCDEDAPRIITQVTTMSATVQDDDALEDIQADLYAKNLLPEQHLVDEGYVDADNLVKSRKMYQVDLVGPAPKDTTWQAQHEQGLDSTQFFIDWDGREVICPAGHVNKTWYDSTDRHGEPVSRILFDPKVCHACFLRQQCTHGKGARGLTLRPKERHEALQSARQREQTDDFKETYRKRAGVEGTISESVRDQGLRRARYVGLDKTHLQSLATAAAINLTRALAWLNGVPLAPTRKSHFAGLAA